MSTSPRLPLLAPPRPSFPAQFHTSDRVSEASSSTTAWPEDAEAQHAESSSVAASSGEVIWQIKTDREVHLDRLEARLQQLRADPPPDLPPEDDAFLLPDSDFDDAEGAGTRSGDEHEPLDPLGDEEGRALLSDAASPATHGLADQTSSPAESDPGAALVREPALPPACSERPSRPTARPVSSRISFKDSVRITSGFRSTSHQPHHHRPVNAFAPITERSGLLTTTGLNRSGSAPSDLLVQAVAPSGASSRSASPRTRGGSRRASQSSTSLAGAANLLHIGSYQYSSSPTSYGASRSSSPCSSIYAPLQPPSRHCPNPMLVRPIGGPLRRKRSSSSFQEFLRKNRHLSDEDDEDGDGDGNGDESDEDKRDPDGADGEELADDADDGAHVRLEYHDLVEQQRAKKARWEARRRVRAAQKRQEALRDAPTLWTKVVRTLLHGRGGGELVNPLPHGARQARAASRTASGRLARQSREHSPVRSSPLARAASHSSLSTVSTLSNSDSDDDAVASSRTGSLRAGPKRNLATTGGAVAGVKTEDDVRFGAAPARYFTIAWIRHQFRRLKRAVFKLFETALVGWRASRRERERERPVRYGAV